MCYNGVVSPSVRARPQPGAVEDPDREVGVLQRRPLALVLLVAAGAIFAAHVAHATAEPPAAAGRAIGDTLTVIARPILAVPEIVVQGGTFTIEARTSPSATGWTATLERGTSSHPLAVDDATYSTSHERWFLTVSVPPETPQEMYDLAVQASGGVSDAERHAVMVRQSIDSYFYIVQITDTHLPTHKYYYEQGADTDTTEMDDLHAVIDDINIINPAFVLLTGDVVNEGELEDFLEKRYYTRAKRILRGLDVPVYLAAGNHDIGGWDDSPPPDGTARWNWWRFFGWRYLYDPPPGDDIYTQNYSFDYGGAHFVAIEAYNNYDRWRRSIYGDDSFTSRQLSWLADDLSAVSPAAPVVAFYHMDFSDQLDLSSLGIDCALWGHTHSTSGSTSSPPFDLSLESVCDGERAMRVVRVAGGTSIDPSGPIDAGPHGMTLRLQFDAANDGTEEEITASIANNHPEMFEHALVKFRVPAAGMPYEVDNGDLFQTTVEGDVATCYVNVVAPASFSTHVTISPSSSSGIGEYLGRGLTLLEPVSPNPALSRASLSFSLGAPGSVRVDVFDVAGRHVRTLRDGTYRGGDHGIEWDLLDDNGGRVAAGVYLWRIASGGNRLTERAVVLR